MKQIFNVRGSLQSAEPVIISGQKVYVHSNVHKVEELDMYGNPYEDLYEYDEIQYSINEYMQAIGEENANLKAQLANTEATLTDTQLALCDVYELAMGGL